MNKTDYMRLCPICDAWYDSTEPDETKEHQHPEPQSGPARAAWLASREPYEVWVKDTPEGRAWRKGQS